MPDCHNCVHNGKRRRVRAGRHRQVDRMLRRIIKTGVPRPLRDSPRAPAPTGTRSTVCAQCFEPPKGLTT